MTTYAVVFPVRPPAPAAPAGPAVGMLPPAGAHGCTGRTKAGTHCNGMAGDDGRCARHKEA